MSNERQGVDHVDTQKTDRIRWEFDSMAERQFERIDLSIIDQLKSMKQWFLMIIYKAKQKTKWFIFNEKEFFVRENFLSMYNWHSKEQLDE